MENVSNEQIVTHLKKELELNSVEAPDGLQMNTTTHKEQTENNEDKAGGFNSNKNNSNSNNYKNDIKFETVCLHCGTCGNTKYPT